MIETLLRTNLNQFTSNHEVLIQQNGATLTLCVVHYQF